MNSRKGSTVAEVSTSPVCESTSRCLSQEVLGHSILHTLPRAERFVRQHGGSTVAEVSTSPLPLTVDLQRCLSQLFQKAYLGGVEGQCPTNVWDSVQKRGNPSPRSCLSQRSNRVRILLRVKALTLGSESEGGAA